MKVLIAKLESDKRHLQEELARTENRSSKLEIQRMSTEGDLQRLQMMLQEKDAHINVSNNNFTVDPSVKIVDFRNCKKSATCKGAP